MFASKLWEYFSYCFTPFWVFFSFFKAKGRVVGRFQRISSFHFLKWPRNKFYMAKVLVGTSLQPTLPGSSSLRRFYHSHRRASTVGGGV